ncbi:hypothetical protein [Rhodospirillum sp. A1_3_36]|uniref:hypothetical protein n=1 Tax=Rhodospirillum sp. A1_3_36 TaxID=3391666 RepID=UPI0039A40D90
MLDQLLDAFRARHRAVRVHPRPVDLTDCFWSSVSKRYVSPRGFGALGGERRVLAYMIGNARFVEKYLRDDNGVVVRENGTPVIRPFGLDNMVNACLCLRDIRNTSFHEISDALEGTHKIQGFRRWHIREIEDTLTLLRPGFNAKTDTCFLFAGAPSRALNRIALSALWLEQMVTLGARACSTMGEREADLMERVFPEDVLAGNREATLRAGYMWDRPLWQPQSAEFLARKTTARRAWITYGGHRAVM